MSASATWTSDAAQEVADRINAAGNGKAIAVKMDVTKREDNAAAVAATVDAFGSINVGLFNAGLNKPRFFMDIDEDNWDMIMNVNTKAMWLGMQETARQMIAQGPMEDHPYKLINVGSIASRKPLVDVTVYCTSKYGCLALTECGALGLAEHNITVNGYAPGVVVTPLWEQLDKDLVEIGFKEREGQAYDDIVEKQPCHQARVLSRRHHRHGLVPRLGRQRLHDRPDDLHRWRLGHEVTADAI
jgi:NAD(P)-dependent dehydrogenase (short-subunit alcohol dehydrogenase family)